MKITARALILEDGSYADDWEPSRSDIEWTKNLVERMNDGGMWATTEGVFRVDKKQKQLVFSGPKLQIFHRVSKCAPHFGYTVRHIDDRHTGDEEHFFSESE